MNKNDNLDVPLSFDMQNIILCSLVFEIFNFENFEFFPVLSDDHFGSKFKTIKSNQIIYCDTLPYVFFHVEFENRI